MSENGQTWGLRLLALAIAVGLWFAISVDKREARGQRAVEASVLYNNPQGLVILDPVQQLTVIVSGPDRQIASLDPSQVSVRVDLAGSLPGLLTVNIGADDVSMPQGLRVESISPNQVPLQLDEKITRRLPIVVSLVGEPAAGAIPGEPAVVPTEMPVEGPRTKLAEIESLATSPVSLDGHAFSFEEQATVVSPDPLIQLLQPARVMVRVPLQVSQPTGALP